MQPGPRPCSGAYMACGGHSPVSTVTPRGPCGPVPSMLGRLGTRLCWWCPIRCLSLVFTAAWPLHVLPASAVGHPSSSNAVRPQKEGRASLRNTKSERRMSRGGHCDMAPWPTPATMAPPPPPRSRRRHAAAAVVLAVLAAVAGAWAHASEQVRDLAGAAAVARGRRGPTISEVGASLRRTRPTRRRRSMSPPRSSCSA